MSGGNPVAAVLTRQEIADKFMQKVIYFNTFGGNSVSAAVAGAVMGIIMEGGRQKNAVPLIAEQDIRLKEVQNRK